MPTPKFAHNEIVFAKLKGFAPWPAKVEFFETIQSTNKIKYHVYFFGTNQIGECKEEDLFPYIQHRDKFGKPKKLSGFLKALSQADSELGLQRHKTTNSVPEKLCNLTPLDYLKAELQVLRIDLGIKNSLNKDKPQFNACLKLLDEYSRTTIIPLMLKKNPELIGTLIKLQVYSRDVNLENPLCNNENKTSDEIKIDLIRKKASNIYHRIQTVFIIPPGMTFTELLAEKLSEFQKCVETMSENDRLQLSRDPTLTE